MKLDKHAWIRPKDMAAYIDRQGLLWVDAEAATVWTQIPFLAPLDCEHGSTACLSCWDSWMCDWEIQDTDPRQDGEHVTAVHYPDVLVTLSDDLSASAVIAKVASALEEVHGANVARAFTEAASSCESYHDALRLAAQAVYILE